MAAAFVGPYEIRAPLGEGGGGQVFRAWDPRLERDVALKILHARFEHDAARVQSFLAEARAASALNHPNIVTVYDAAVEGRTSFIVSELIDGRSLREELQRGPLGMKRLLDLATQIADGLSAAHEVGILHGDLKPENIMVTRTGRAKIVDFGLTRAAGLATAVAAPDANTLQTETEHGLVAGTVPYMSPERARGLAGDFRSDQFSFGLVLYEMATGQRAFAGATPAATLDAILNDEASPLETRDQRLPVQLRWIIERCLAKDPIDRYSATADLHRDLRTLRDRLAEAWPAGPAVTPARSRSRVLLAVAAGAVLIAGGVIATLMLSAPSPPDLSLLSFVPFVIDPGYQGFPAVSPDGTAVAYSAEVDGVLQIFTRKIGASESFQVTHEHYDCKHAFWSPDGQRIYYVSLAGRKDGIYAIDATSGTPQLVVRDATRGAISPNQLTIAFFRDDVTVDVVGTLALWVATPGGLEPWGWETVQVAAKKRDTFGGQQFIEGTLAFSPDGLKLGICVVPDPREKESLWQFWIVPVDGRRAYRRLESWTEPAPRLSSFSWLPDSRHVVLGATSLRTPGSHLWIADLDRDRTWMVTDGADSESYPSVSSTGEFIVFSQGEPHHDLVEISLDRRQIRPLLQTTRNESDPDVSRDGTRMVYVTDRSGQDEIWLHWRDGRQPDSPLVTQADFGADATLMLASPGFAPRGDRLAYLRNGRRPRFLLRVWISTVDSALRTPVLPRDYEAMQGAPTWSPTGQEIAYPELKNDRWNLMTLRVSGKEDPVTVRRDGVANASAHWSPTGEWITWETPRGLVLVSPDGARIRPLGNEHEIWTQVTWLVHAWSHDGTQIFGITQTDDRRLKLMSARVATGAIKELMDLGLSPVVNNPVKGFSVSADGRTFTTSLAQAPGDLWLLKGLRR